DRIHECGPHTGSKTLIRVTNGEGSSELWEPFNREHDDRFNIHRNLYKSALGNKLCFEEINPDLDLAFRYTWMMSAEYGFVRRAELRNLAERVIQVELIDGLQNLLPARTPRFTQTTASNLVDAYKWSEADEDTGMAFFSLYAGITDRAEPCESLRATTAFSLGLPDAAVLVSSTQLGAFRRGEPVQAERLKRGIRCAYFNHARLSLAAGERREWYLVSNLEQSQAQVVSIRTELRTPEKLQEALRRSIEAGSDDLARIMAGADGFQATAEENVSLHHYANVLFNVLRGGIFDDQYAVSREDFSATVRHFNKTVYNRNREFLVGLPDKLQVAELQQKVDATGDAQLQRLAYEYLPITFGRRHGDPSRPWNQFAIRLKDENGARLLSYQGNWRDIFQNWEALTFSFPGFIENVIAKFVNASTMDGYNPYRITKEGIDWEVEEPDDPWSYIGYWGDHQIIYLLKLLELSAQFHPAELHGLLRKPIFSYANVPYRIRPFEALLENAKATVDFDLTAAERVDERVASMGADGKLVLDRDGNVYQANLLEKLLVPMLAKLGNLVIDGGIWLNTQRPEWNDANNALVGHGLSMVTLYYLRRYLRFLQDLLADEADTFEVSTEVRDWLTDTAAALQECRPLLNGKRIDPKQRKQMLCALGEAAGRYRQRIYEQGSFSGRVTIGMDQLSDLLDSALAAVDNSIATNRRGDGLYHAYNLLALDEAGVEVDSLYPMLEGQVAALSSGALSPAETVDVVEALFASSIYRPDQASFMLYPDRELPGFLEKNRVPPDQVAEIPLLQRMLDSGDERIILRDADGILRFNSRFSNQGDLQQALDELLAEPGLDLENARQDIATLYEAVFNHKAFTGRSGTMFGFEGLGSIYWHMVAKLLLAVQENYFAALREQADPGAIRRLGELYYRIRAGIGFNKTPEEYGAFPTDPYSHTPKHAGARQPGMTGQVKEEVLTRFGELGVRVEGGVVRFEPALLRRREFLSRARDFCFLGVDQEWHSATIPAGAIGFTWCQVPVSYRLSAEERGITVTRDDGTEEKLDGLALSADLSSEWFERSGAIRAVEVRFPADLLFRD
ncbi:MAG: hypothetical protein R3200_12105, partial [Xanthomonadales bacterium]|nr:hypothetical protein [Xanthomonadales bacterium]